MAVLGHTWICGEGRKWLDELLAKAGEQPAAAVTPPSRRAFAKVLDGVARMRARWSEFAEEMEVQNQALALWRELGDTRGTAETLNNLAVTMRDLGDRARARDLVEESLALFRDYRTSVESPTRSTIWGRSSTRKVTTPAPHGCSRKAFRSSRPSRTRGVWLTRWTTWEES